MKNDTATKIKSRLEKMIGEEMKKGVTAFLSGDKDAAKYYNEQATTLSKALGAVEYILEQDGKTGPIYEHDCDKCQFLGTFKGKTIDLYYCDNLFIYRYSDKPEDNVCSPVEYKSKQPEFIKAREIAKSKGII